MRFQLLYAGIVRKSGVSAGLRVCGQSVRPTPGAFTGL